MTLLGVGGDFDRDGDVDGADFFAWQRHPTAAGLAGWTADFGGDSGALGYQAVPEPTALALVLLASAWLTALRRHR